MRLHYPGLMAETLPSGNTRFRVRVKGQKARKITLPFGPEHPDFQDAYAKARAGIRPSPSTMNHAERGTVGWLVSAYLSHVAQMVAAGQMSALTLKQRKGFAPRILDRESQSGASKGRPWRDLPMAIPAHELVAFRDDLMATPGAAKNIFKMIKAMYVWAVARGHCDHNPAAAITVAYTSKGGATPWTMEDLQKFRKTHPIGTRAHLALSLFMFTACRIGDAIHLGRSHEVTRNGQQWLAWEPSKRGSKPVEIPILPPLAASIRAQKVIGPTYLLTGSGTPFASPEGLRNALERWCKEAGVVGRSSHGIRKAAGHLMALNGATQYEIMAVHGHAQASTSEVYTRGVERVALAQQAASRLAEMDW